jgi:hypothetical protein
MEVVEYNLAVRFRQVLPYRRDIWVPHVHRHRPDAADLLGRQCFPEAIQAALLTVFSHVQHAPPDEIIHQSQIAVPLPKCLLIDADLAHQFSLAQYQPTLDRPLHDAGGSRPNSVSTARPQLAGCLPSTIRSPPQAGL